MANEMRREADKSRDEKMRSMKVTTADLDTDQGSGHVLHGQGGVMGAASGERAEGYKRGGRVAKKDGGCVEGGAPRRGVIAASSPMAVMSANPRRAAPRSM
jgi:hypothetical protein